MSLLSELNVYLEKAFYGSDLLDGPILPMLDCHHGPEHYLGYRPVGLFTDVYRCYRCLPMSTDVTGVYPF